MPLEIEDQRAYPTKRLRAGEGDHPTIGLQTRNARHRRRTVFGRPKQLRRVDIVDEVEPALPVEGHRARRDAGLKRRHRVHEDIRSLQTRWIVPVVACSAGVIIRKILRNTDDAGSAAIGLQTVDDRPVGDMDAPLGTDGQGLRMVTAILRRGGPVPVAGYVRRVDLVATEGGYVVPAVGGGHGADRARLPARRQRPHRGRQGKPRHGEKAMETGCHLSCPSVQQRQLVCATVGGHHSHSTVPGGLWVTS